MNEDTEQKIQSALLSLLAQGRYDAISINDISENAGIVRQTFYSYFKSKDELLLSFMDDIFAQFLEELDSYLEELVVNQATHINSKDMVSRMFQTWLTHYNVLIHIVNADIDDLVFKRFRNYIARVTGRVVTKLSITRVADETFFNYTVDVIAGAIFHILMRWMKNGTPYSPQQMAAIVSLPGSEIAINKS